MANYVAPELAEEDDEYLLGGWADDGDDQDFDYRTYKPRKDPAGRPLPSKELLLILRDMVANEAEKRDVAPHTWQGSANTALTVFIGEYITALGKAQMR